MVLKVVGDPAWERAVRRSLTTADFDDVPGRRPTARPRCGPCEWLRGWTTRHASGVVTPSEHLRATVAGWSGRDDVVVIPNGVRAPSAADAADARDAPPTEGARCGCCSSGGSCPGSASSC